MKNNYENLHYFEARSPEKLKDQLKAIDNVHTIMPGGWLIHGQMFGVWVLFDRPVGQVKKKNLSNNKIELEKQTKEV